MACKVPVVVVVVVAGACRVVDGYGLVDEACVFVLAPQPLLYFCGLTRHIFLWLALTCSRFRNHLILFVL